MNLLRISLVVVAMMAFVMSGCGEGTGTEKSDKTDKTEKKDDGHSDAHHHHMHGPNDGSHFLFEGTEEFAGEVVSFGENNVVKIAFCDLAGKETMKLKAEKVTVARASGDETTPFELTAVEPDADGLTDSFMLDSEDLKIAVKVGAVTVKATIDGKEYTGKAMPHNH